jgi:hypothetical protein
MFPARLDRLAGSMGEQVGRPVKRRLASPDNAFARVTRSRHVSSFPA